MTTIEHEVDRWHACIEEELESVIHDELIAIWNQIKLRLWSTKNNINLRFKIKVDKCSDSLCIIAILSIIRILLFVNLT